MTCKSRSCRAKTLKRSAAKRTRITTEHPLAEPEVFNRQRAETMAGWMIESLYTTPAALRRKLGVDPVELVQWMPLGEVFRATREKRGLDIKAAAAAARLTQRKIRALEQPAGKCDLAAALCYAKSLDLEQWLGRWLAANPELLPARKKP